MPRHLDKSQIAKWHLAKKLKVCKGVMGCFYQYMDGVNVLQA